MIASHADPAWARRPLLAFGVRVAQYGLPLLAGTAVIRRQLRSDHPDEQEAAVTMLALVTALGRHDRHTRGHSERVRLFCDLLGTELGLRDTDRGKLRWVGLIHDIGK